jgi:hypothetical protein
MINYENQKHNGWTKEWIDKINKHPMISKDTVHFFDQEKFYFLYINVMKMHPSTRKMFSYIQDNFWNNRFSKSYAKRFLKNLDRLEFMVKKIKFQQKLDKIKKDF